MHLGDRWTLGKMQNPVRGFLHGTAALLAVAAMVWLLLHATGGFPRRIPLLVFGIALIVLYVVSTLYHTIPWRELWKKRMQRLDHAAIIAFIAASYTPLASVVFSGWLRTITLVAVWSIAAAGIIDLIFFPRPHTGMSIALSTTLGWLAVLLAWPVAQRLPWPAIAMLGIGGIFYTVGMVFLVTNRPRLWPRVFSYHELFHLLVIAGSALHFAVVLRYVARYTGAA